MRVKTKMLANGQEVKRIRFSSGRTTRAFDLGFEARQMFMLGKRGNDIIRERVASGIGSGDQSMPGIKAGYARFKSKRGLKNIRDLRGTGRDGGNMLDNLSVRSFSRTEARSDVSSAKARAKARANEKRAAWFGWSAGDLAKLASAAEKLWKDKVASFGFALNGREPFSRRGVVVDARQL